jgi:alkylated DNA repair dioxygenase AlkB
MFASEFLKSEFNLLPDGTEGLYFLPDFLPSSEADQFFKELKDEVEWEQKSIRIFGKEVPEPRLTAWYGDPAALYTYSGITMKPLPWIPALEALRNRIETITSATFNSALLNYYRSGQDSMGWHRDNEKELGPEPVIASLSLGAQRDFQIRNYQYKNQKLEIPLNHGSLLIMRGRMQENWQHAVPKRKNSQTERINITFRQIF